MTPTGRGDFPEIDKNRLYVIDEEGQARSDVWFVHSKGNNVYVAPRRLGGALKLSLHPAGGADDGCDCQFGHPRFHADLQASLGYKPMRPLRWTRTPTPDRGAVQVVSILWPTDYLGPAPQPEDDGKIKFAIPLAPSGGAAEVGLFISKQAPNELEEGFIRAGGTPLIYMDLPNGEFVSIVIRHRTMDDLSEVLARLQTLSPTPLSGAPAPGEWVAGRGIIVGEPPPSGEAFQLIEVGPMNIGLPLVPSK